MVNLSNGDAITNTAGEPPESGISGPSSKTTITLSKYVNEAYDEWELLFDDISYEPVSENGYDVIRVVLRIIADTKKTHVFSFPSLGFNQMLNNKLTRIVNESDGGDAASPRLLDATGAAIPLPTSAPFLTDPYIISVGRNELSDWSSLTLPSSIP
jgi:hypothetical protein